VWLCGNRAQERSNCRTRAASRVRWSRTAVWRGSSGSSAASPARGQSASPTATARFSRTTGLAVRSSRQPRRFTGRPPIRADQKPFTAVSFSP
jgi:hypothetical protein